MRTFVLTLGIVAGLLILPAASADTAAALGLSVGAVALDSAGLDTTQDPPKAPIINIEVNKGGGKQWYANPIWIAIGVLGALVVIVLIVMAAKGGGTTVVKS